MRNHCLSESATSRKGLKHFVFFRKLNPDVEWGGTEVVLMNWFSKIDYQRCRATLVVPKGSTGKFAPRLEVLKVPVNVVEYEFPRWGSSPRQRFTKMLNFFSDLNPSGIIFVQGWYIDFGSMEVLAAFFSTWGNIFMHENVGPDMPPPKKTKKYFFGLIPGLGFWWHKQNFSVYAKAYLCRKVFFVSKNILEQFVKLRSYPRHNSLVMYHGTELEKFFPSADVRKVLREKMKVSDSDIVIIATARLAKLKCLDRLIDAFDNASKNFGNLRLFLVGTGPLEHDLKQLANSKAARDKIQFLGHVDNVPDLLRMSDIYVLSSDNEGLSLALMESMASGLICISTNCPGSSEIIEDGVNGFLVERSTEAVSAGLRKALKLTSEDKVAMSQKARKTVYEKFNVNLNIKKIFDLFKVPFKG